MNLSYKATQFIIEAIEYQIQAYQERLNQEDLDEDEASDLINDSGFLEALCTDLKKNLSEGEKPDVIKPSDRSSKGLMRQVLQLSMNERLSLVDAITESIRQEFQSRQVREPSGEHPNDAIVSVSSVYFPPAPAAYYSKEGGQESRKE